MFGYKSNKCATLLPSLKLTITPENWTSKRKLQYIFGPMTFRGELLVSAIFLVENCCCSQPVHTKWIAAHLRVCLSEGLLMVIKTLLLRLIGTTHIHHNGRLAATERVVKTQGSTSLMRPNWNAILTPLYLFFLHLALVGLNLYSKYHWTIQFCCHRVRLVDFLCLSCSQNRETLKFIKTSGHWSPLTSISWVSVFNQQKNRKKSRKMMQFFKNLPLHPMILSECFHVFYRGFNENTSWSAYWGKRGNRNSASRHFSMTQAMTCSRSPPHQKKKRFKEKKDPVQVLVENLAPKRNKNTTKCYTKHALSHVWLCLVSMEVAMMGANKGIQALPMVLF